MTDLNQDLLINMQTLDISQSQEIFTVTQLNREVRFILESSFPLLWVEGEISNFSAPNSGHWYFCLKDANAQVRCAMFRMSNRRLNFSPKDGMHVLVKAKCCMQVRKRTTPSTMSHIKTAKPGLSCMHRSLCASQSLPTG